MENNTAPIPVTALPVVTIALDGKDRRLLYNGRAMRLIEEKRPGRNLLKASAWKDLSVSDVVVYLWAGLYAGAPKDQRPTEDEIADLVHYGNLEYISDKIQEAFTACVPKREAAEETADPTAEPPATV